MGSSLDREMAAQLQLTINARDENGKGNTGTAPLIVNLLDVNDNAPIFEKDVYEFALNSDLTNFSTPAIIKVNLLSLILNWLIFIRKIFNEYI